MSSSAPDPRHRAVELLEGVLVNEEHPAPAHLARVLVSRLEAAGLVIHDAPAPTPRGRCEVHGAPFPCQGCAGDAKAKRETGEVG
jgi:hypothetical protein